MSSTYVIRQIRGINVTFEMVKSQTSKRGGSSWIARWYDIRTKKSYELLGRTYAQTINQVDLTISEAR